MSLVKKIEALLPEILLKVYRNSKRYLNWKIQQYLYAQEVGRLRKNDKPLNVIFLVLYPSVWKYDSVYQLMEKDPMFNPLILACPAVDQGEEHMMETLHGTYDYLSSKGYNVQKSYDEQTHVYTDIRTLNPDILFYASQWDGHYDVRYRSRTLKKYLKCYVNYSYKNNPFEWSIASQFQGRMWMYFSECEDNRKLALSFNKREFKNIHVVGYPMYDEIMSTIAKGKDWKLKNKSLKRIIWAPHHSIEGQDGLIKLSTFLLHAETMLSLAEKYKDQVQWVFKPHPQLKAVLYRHPNWGKERTDAFYKQWEDRENTNYVNGAYVDLFKSSDAMIHDCHSFVVEYLYMNKPVMFLANYDREGQSNEVGKKAFHCHYEGTTAEDIERFIVDVVINGNDTMADKRQQFYTDILVPPNGLSVAENIINEIKKELQI